MKRNTFGFNLLEVMVAMAILAMAISTLLIVRNNAIKDAGNAIEMNKIRKLLEQQMGKIAAGIETNNNGDFSSLDYPNYIWRATIEKISPISVRDVNGKLYQISLRKITVAVKNRRRPGPGISLVGYFPIHRPEEEKPKSITPD